MTASGDSGSDRGAADLAAASAGADEAPAGRTVIERPPPGLARGFVSAPAWGIVAIAGSVLLVGMVALAWRALSWRRHRRELAAPRPR
jgi:hypothetical protein